MTLRCWCGNDDLAPFDNGYRRCDACQTLVSIKTAERFDPAVADDSADFYGRDYWFDHQTRDLGTADIVTRSRTDLADRAVHWMRSLLRFVVPPAKVLEIGCGHGGFTAMMNRAGFDATGLELSPSIVELATQTFGINVLTGPVESQSIPPETFDAVVMLDVIEHLPDPVGTLTKCFKLIKPGGVLFGQTPEYPSGTSVGQLTAGGHKFPRMLDPAEHLYLYSAGAIERLFGQIGGESIRFVPAVFDFYDQSFFVGRSPLIETTESQRDSALERTVDGRMIRAMLDIDLRRLSLLDLYRRKIRDSSGSWDHGPGRTILPYE